MKYIVILGVALAAGDAQAGFFNGNQLHEACQRSSQSMSGYVAGWIDKHLSDSEAIDITLSQTAGNKDVALGRYRIAGNICYPDGITVQQARDVVCKYLDTHPAERTTDGGYLLQTVFTDAWPCRN